MNDVSSTRHDIRADSVHALPRLPYGFDALEPHIDAQTLQIHYRKHHHAYIDSLNAALEDHPDLQSRTAEALCRDIHRVPDAIRTAVRQAAGGHWNHSRFWTWMTPSSGGSPIGRSSEAITASFGDIRAFKEQFSATAIGLCGSGWTWLIKDGSALSIATTPNQDNPLMDGLTPILGLDVWEHAYYLKYQNRRADYVKAWWGLVNWAEVDRSY